MATNSQAQALRAAAKYSFVTFKDMDDDSRAHFHPLTRIIVLKSESPERFEKLFASLLEEFQPRTPTEHHFVQTMASARWRLIRNTTWQIALLKNDPTGRGLELLQREKRILKRLDSSARRNFLEFRKWKTCSV